MQSKIVSQPQDYPVHRLLFKLKISAFRNFVDDRGQIRFSFLLWLGQNFNFLRLFWVCCKLEYVVGKLYNASQRRYHLVRYTRSEQSQNLVVFRDLWKPAQLRNVAQTYQSTLSVLESERLEIDVENAFFFVLRALDYLDKSFLGFGFGGVLQQF